MDVEPQSNFGGLFMLSYFFIALFFSFLVKVLEATCPIGFQTKTLVEDHFGRRTSAFL